MYVRVDLHQGALRPVIFCFAVIVPSVLVGHTVHGQQVRSDSLPIE
jgi:hypothetical protein